MEFVNPNFLYGLFAIAIPVIIHLFNFRRFKRVYFSNLNFIRDLKQQTQKQSRLKHLLVLLMRMLAIASIVLAFAQPFIPRSENIISPDKQNVISVYIDNSFSMQAESEDGLLIDHARQKAAEVVSVFKSSDVFQLLTNDFEGKHQHFMSKEEFLNVLDEVIVSPVVRNLEEVINHQLEFIKEQESEVKSVFIISDFQKSILPQDFNISDSLVNIYFIPVKAINSDNLSIDSCWFASPVQQVNQHAELYVSLRNFSNQDYEKIPLKLSVNGQQKALASFDIMSQSSIEIPLSFTNHDAGIQYGKLEIDDYPISFDDYFYFSYSVSAVSKILAINQSESNPYLKSLFKNDSSFVFDNVQLNNIDYSSLGTYGLVIFNELKTIPSGLVEQISLFVENGGSLAILPTEEMDIENYKSFLSDFGQSYYLYPDTSTTDISYLNLEHPLYQDVFEEIPENIDLPRVFKSFVINRISRAAQEVILELQNGNIFLNKLEYGNGEVYLFSCPFSEEYSSFPRHAIFVPTLYKIALSGIKSDQLYTIIGSNEPIQISQLSMGSDAVYTIKSQGSDFEFIPEHRAVNSHIDIFPRNQIAEAGNYSLLDGQEIIKGLAFNYNKMESDMTFFTVEELSDFLSNSGNSDIMIIEESGKPFVQTLKEISQGVHFWKWLILLALILLAIEGLLLRFWK
jgi:hypothetical protein